MNSTFKADLHCHTTCSDGTETPEAVIRLAKHLSLQGLSITDHDTIAAYETALSFAKEVDLLLVPGVEFSAWHREEPVHVLGYAYSLESESINSFCLRHRQRRKERNRGIIHRLNKLGIQITLEEVEAHHEGTIGRPHIALILMKKGIVSSVKEAFQRYLAEGKPGYEPGERFSVEETIECIHQGKGFAILAHPQLIQRSTTVRNMQDMPFDGLEGYYASMSSDIEKKWIDIAKEKNWIITGGSDFHGDIKPQNHLGSSWVNEETFHIFYDHFRSHTSF